LDFDGNLSNAATWICDRFAGRFGDSLGRLPRGRAGPSGSITDAFGAFFRFFSCRHSLFPPIFAQSFPTLGTLKRFFLVDRFVALCNSGYGRPTITQIVSLAKQTLAEFRRHKCQWLAAAIAYFTMFAIAPLLILIVEIVGFFLGRHQAVLNQLYGYLSSTAGPTAAQGIQSVVTATFSHRGAGIVAQIVGWCALAFAAMGLFASLQNALNTVWDVVPPKKDLLETLKGRLLSFAMVLAVAFVLLVSLGVNSAMTVAATATAHVFPFFPALLKVVDFAVSFALITTVFALLFEYLPECPIAWRDVWLGAAVSALLFVAGQFLLGWYLGHAAISSLYGAFGGIVAFLLWSYYSAQILLLGAEFTHAQARRLESGSGDSAAGSA
jgi:membrane protein